MAMTSLFKQRRQVTPPTNNPATQAIVDLRGLDLVSPYDMIEKNRSPFARNFRLYADDHGDRRVAVTTRKGSGFYTIPIGEALSEEEAVATDVDINFTTTEWAAMQFAGDNRVLTKLELPLKRTDGRGAVVVEIRVDNAGLPGDLVADSGLEGSEIEDTYNPVEVRFIEAPLLEEPLYWIVVKTQSDGSGNYQWAGNSSGTSAATTNSGNGGWSNQAYSANYASYTSDNAEVKGLARYAPESADNVTLAVIGTTMYKYDDVDGTYTTVATGLNANATDYVFDYADGKIFWVNGYDDLKAYDGTTVETITAANLPILADFCFHKTRLMGIPAGERNKLIWSEAPGNPSTNASNQQWYYWYLSTSFLYTPEPKASDPVTAVISFQDNLYVVTTTGKWVLYGSDPGSYYLRESTGNKGVFSRRTVVKDENYIYFMGPDGLFYRHNGSIDEVISDRVLPEVRGIADRAKVFIVAWKSTIRFYYPANGAPKNNRCLIWHTIFEEWMIDTDAYVTRAISWKDGNDPRDLVEASATGPFLMKAEQNDHNLGKQMDFKYWMKYESFGSPARRKRIVKFFPLIEGNTGRYPVTVLMDKDRRDQPTSSEFMLETSGAIIGDFIIGDGTVFGSANVFAPRRLRVSGYAYYWQPRIERKAINNPVRFIGYELSYRQKRL